MLFEIFNFWAAIFPLPKESMDVVERMCNTFLWNGSPDLAKGAKISWESVCTLYHSGGLGLRRLDETNEVYGLKLI